MAIYLQNSPQRMHIEYLGTAATDSNVSFESLQRALNYWILTFPILWLVLYVLRCAGGSCSSC